MCELGQRIVVVLEFSGVCRENPVRLVRALSSAGGRLVSYDPTTRIMLGTLKLRPLYAPEFEKRVELLVNEVLRGLDDCRLWTKLVLHECPRERLRGLAAARLASSSGEVLVVRLANYAYALWPGKEGVARLEPVGRASERILGDLSALSHPCGNAMDLLERIREDASQLAERLTEGSRS